MAELGDHGNVFALAFAVNTAYGLIPDLVERMAVPLARHVGWVEEQAKAARKGGNDARAIECDNLAFDYRQAYGAVAEIRNWFLKTVPWAAIVAGLLVIAAAYCPKLSLPLWVFMIGDALLLGPVPLCVVLMRVKVRVKNKELAPRLRALRQ